VLHYDRYLRNQLTDRVRQRLQSRIEESLQRELVEIIRSTQEEIYSEFTESNIPGSSPHILSSVNNAIPPSLPGGTPTIVIDQMISTPQSLGSNQITSSQERERGATQVPPWEALDGIGSNTFMAPDRLTPFDSRHWNIGPPTPPTSDEQVSNNPSSPDSGNSSNLDDIWLFLREHPG
jgi:hypothetical protein